MPFYHLGLGIVHIKGSKLPEPCAAHVLIEGKEHGCLAASSFLCDGPSKSGKGTCDATMCEPRSDPTATCAPAAAQRSWTRSGSATPLPTSCHE